MPTVTIAPVGKHQFFDDDGDPLAGGQLFIYEAGTSTKATSYADSDGSSANANPIVLDSAGRATIFLGTGAFKFVLATSTDTDPPTSPIWTVDGIEGVPLEASNGDITGVLGEAATAGKVVFLSDGTAERTAGRWYLTSATDSTASVDAGILGILLPEGAVEAFDAGDTVVIRRRGSIAQAGLVAGTVYYLGAAGALVSTAPAETTSFVLAFAQAQSATSLIFPYAEASETDGLKGIAYSSGNGNAAGGGDTELTDYAVTILANYVPNAGDMLVVEGTIATADNTAAKSLKIRLGESGTLITVWSYPGAV